MTQPTVKQLTTLLVLANELYAKGETRPELDELVKEIEWRLLIAQSHGK